MPAGLSIDTSAHFPPAHSEAECSARAFAQSTLLEQRSKLKARLRDFLISAFSVEEIRRLLAALPFGDKLVPDLPGRIASHSDVAAEAVEIVDKHGLIQLRAFWDQMVELRPLLRNEIQRLHTAFARTQHTRATSTPRPRPFRALEHVPASVRPDLLRIRAKLHQMQAKASSNELVRDAVADTTQVVGAQLLGDLSDSLIGSRKVGAGIARGLTRSAVQQHSEKEAAAARVFALSCASELERVLAGHERSLPASDLRRWRRRISRIRDYKRARTIRKHILDLINEILNARPG